MVFKMTQKQSTQLLKNQIKQQIYSELNKHSIIDIVKTAIDDNIKSGIINNPEYFVLDLFSVLNQYDRFGQIKLDLTKMYQEYANTLAVSNDCRATYYINYTSKEFLYNMRHIPNNLRNMLNYFENEYIQVSIDSFTSKTSLILKFDLT